ncbi:LOW QUALITY PROTEIN: uncharacterized protein LOC100846605 [Brachypodium distachyon]|uniref:LOW QUALITY PROTEIN: uncharacterized protein LOC100846605 n=1 Tax=Brachypodium distachyon TaxID=15368 RepID=UPI00052FF7A5|nr:LOW QUALITY PROTEIN: uncharacterized protein LOC100846605 [Brachypodium distachyon]|eukprot:XP_010231833.1 LOW QUALITY PROTEIN: uncharacterized protein LOC100846605 [Brachypodium distachyon]
MAGTAQATALDIYEVPFSDLHLLLSPEAVAGDDDEGRRRRLLDTVGAALGRGGTGLLAVAGVPRAAALRRRILPLARRLALMDHPSRAHLLKKHGLGSDVPLKKLDRSVSSFAWLLRHGDSGKLHLPLPESEEVPPPGVDRFGEHKGDDDDDDDDVENLGELFKELGLCMMELGILVARACDIVTGGNQLEQTIADFGSAKVRLIHYHSELDNIVIKENSKNRRNLVRNARTTAKPALDHMDKSYQRPGSEDGSCIRSGKEKDCKDMVTQGQSSAVSLENLWQEWHYDYGVLTVLTA